MLAADTMLGPYRIVASIGAGGMGEVYRAVDTRLGREVAVKVLTPSLGNDTEALRRFEQEARAAGMLNHPNILTIYDIGTSGDTRYIVSELLDGESIRARLRQGAIPPRKATDYAGQIARGLAAAHEKGIIHRDLKPENLFLTRDGQVKILDFGLVKLMAPRLPGAQVAVDDHAPTLPATPTEPGRLLGTVGYMAPEQIRGGSGDHRSDIFAFGAILFEMLTARQPFRGESPIETLNAILKEEPAEFYDLGIRIPSSLERIVRHCLEKNPEERFQSARDLAFDLGAMSGLTSQALSFRARPRIRFRDVWKPALAALVIAAAIGAGFFFGTRHGQQPPPSFKRLTFRGGTILNARFGPDGQTVYYGAKWAGSPVSVFAARPDSPESRDLGFGVADVLAVGANGQLAISLRRHPIGYVRESGTLAQVPIAGGAPRELLDDVEAADWSPDGRLAVVRTVDNHSRLELPIGKVVYQTEGWLSQPRVSPKGDAIAVLDHKIINDDRGTLVLIELASGKSRTLGPEWQSAEGVAWRPDGKEVWVGAERPGTSRALIAIDMKGRDRLIATTAGAIWLQDISRDGRVLATRENVSAGIEAILPGETRERDLSWLDFSIARDLSADGKSVLFSESGEGGGPGYGVYLRKLDGSPAVRLGDGTSEAISPDGAWVLSIPRDQKHDAVVMLPTGAGQPRTITHDKLTHRNARWFPDGRQVLFQGSEPGRPPRLWVQSIDGGAPRAISSEGIMGTQITADGKRVLGRTPDRHYVFLPVDGGEPEPVATLRGNDVPVRFTEDGKSVFVGTFGKVPAMLYRVDLATGERTVVREALPPDPAGIINVGPILTTSDGRTAVYSFTRLLSDLYIVKP